MTTTFSKRDSRETSFSFVEVSNKVSPCNLIAVSDALSSHEQNVLLKVMTCYNVNDFTLGGSITIKKKVY